MPVSVGDIETTDAADLQEAVARARRGDREALELVLLSLAPAISRFGMRMCKDVHDAEDVLQETLLRVVQHLDGFEGRSSLTSWAFALTRSACARKRRGLKNQPHESDERLAEAPDERPSPEDRAADHELASALSAALARLSDEHREVIALRDVEGLSAAEASASLGISVGALKSRLHRAREALRVQFLPQLEPKPGCPDVVEGWSKKLEGDLTPSDCAAMEKHIETCAPCGSACDALKRALLACEHARAEVPLDVQASVKSAVRAWASQPDDESRP